MLGGIYYESALAGSHRGVSRIQPSSLERHWPVIQPVHRRVLIDLHSERIQIDVPIKAQDGKVVYTFACRGGSDRYLDTLPENWVGPLMCTLAEGTRATETSLLSEDDSAAWHSRGQYRPEDLVGACGDYPEYGRHRSFRLRGMRVTLDAQDVSGDARGVQSFVLAIDVAADSTATTPKADQPGFLDPRRQGRSCTTVLRGRDVRMCRNAMGSWEPCKE